MTKVAVGCAEIDTLEQRLTGRAVDGETYVVTRFKPKQADALVGGSLYWIVKHRLVARSEILGFEDDPDGRRIRIRLADRLIPIRAIPKRAHQGWRYLPESDAPADLLGDEAEGLASLPAPMAAELAALALI